MPQTVLALPLVLMCIGISALWVHPVIHFKRLSRRARLLTACGLSALAAMGLFYHLAQKGFLSRHGPHSHMASCQNQLKQLGLMFMMYANESDGSHYPELSRHPGTLAARSDGTYPGLHPEYLTDLGVLRCPKTPRPTWWSNPPAPTTAEDDLSYFYLGYRIPDQKTLEHFSDAYRAVIKQGGTFDSSLVVGGDTSMTIWRLGDRSGFSPGGLTSFQAIREAQSKIPVLIERYPNRHGLDAGNVLYMDGHVERIPWGEKWPMTEEAMAVLLALDGLGD